MDDRHLIEKKLSGKELFKGRLLHAFRDTVLLPDGATAPREFLEVFSASPAQLLKWCCDGTVTDAKTLTAALWLQNVLSGRWDLKWLPPIPGGIAG